MYTDDLSESRLEQLWIANKNPQKEEGGAENQVNADDSHDLLDGFYADPFVSAVAMFRAQRYHGILEVLTDAVKNGM